MSGRPYSGSGCRGGIGGLQPVFVDVDLELVARIAGIVGPQVNLAETNLVENQGGQAGAMIGEALGIAEGTMDEGNFAGLAANEPWRAAMAERRTVVNQDALADREPGSKCQFPS